MQTLMATEVEEVSGGVIPAILAGIAGADIYDTIGSKDYISCSWDFLLIPKLLL